MYKLGHLGLYKNVPKKSMFNPTPDYANDAYTLLQYKSHLRNEFLIPLKARGDGTGVATIRLQSLETQSVKITGNGKFYTDASGATELGTESTIGTSLTRLYVKIPAGESCYLVCGKADKLSGLGNTGINLITEATNAPIINGCKIAYKLASLSYIRMDGVANSFLLGSIDNTPSLTYLNLYFHQPTVLTGSIDNTPNLMHLELYNNILTALTGSIDNTPNLTVLSVYNNILTAFTGDIGKAINCYYFRAHINTKCTFTYVTQRNNWTSAYDTLWVSCASMTSTMVDNLLIDLDASDVVPTASKLIRLDGLCGAVTEASAAARTSLVSKGFIVTVNTQGE